MKKLYAIFLLLLGCTELVNSEKEVKKNDLEEVLGDVEKIYAQTEEMKKQLADYKSALNNIASNMGMTCQLLESFNGGALVNKDVQTTTQQSGIQQAGGEKPVPEKKPITGARSTAKKPPITQGKSFNKASGGKSINMATGGKSFNKASGGKSFNKESGGKSINKASGAGTTRKPGGPPVIPPVGKAPARGNGKTGGERIRRMATTGGHHQ